MDASLLQASLHGDVLDLRHLISTNPLVLDPFTLPMQQTTPLHVAALAGHDGFVAAVLVLKPQMGHVQNELGMYPVHLAAAGGHWKAVEVMLRADRRLGCLADREGRTAAHVAAACGRFEVLEGLVKFDGSFADARTDVEGESILHTGVRHNQLGAVKAIVRLREDLLDLRDVSGNTVLHLAISRGNKVIANYLLTETAIDVNTQNEEGEAATEMVERANTKYFHRVLTHVPSFAGDSQNRRSFRTFGTRVGIDQKLLDKEYLRDKQNTILVVATVIAGATFETGIEHAKEFTAYRVCNTLSFGLSVALFLILASGGTLKHWVQTRIVLMILWASLFFMALAYGVFTHRKDGVIYLDAIIILLIVGMGIVLGGHLYVFISYLVMAFITRNGPSDESSTVGSKVGNGSIDGSPRETPRRPLLPIT